MLTLTKAWSADQGITLLEVILSCFSATTDSLWSRQELSAGQRNAISSFLRYTLPILRRSEDRHSRYSWLTDLRWKRIIVMESVLRVSQRRLRVTSDSQGRYSRAVHARDPLVVSATHESNVDLQVFERLKYTRAHISATRSEATFDGRVTQHRQTGRYILKDCPLMSPFRDRQCRLYTVSFLTIQTHLFLTLQRLASLLRASFFSATNSMKLIRQLRF